MKTFKINTKKSDEVIDITERVNGLVKESDVDQGICFLSVLHTTAALSTADLDPGTDLDMLDAFREIVPNLDYRHPHDPDHVPDHILATLIGPSLTLPVRDGEPVLGTWQRVVLLEFNGPRERSVVFDVLQSG